MRKNMDVLPIYCSGCLHIRPPKKRGIRAEIAQRIANWKACELAQSGYFETSNPIRRCVDGEIVTLGVIFGKKYPETILKKRFSILNQEAENRTRRP